MKKITTLTLGAMSLMALAAGCTVEAVEAPGEEIATNEEALVCSNEQAVNSVLASMATAAAQDMRRWLPDRDLYMSNGELKMTSYATGRCPLNSSGVKECKRMKAALALQDWDMHGMIIAGQALDVGVLRSRVATQFQRQMDCINRPDNNAADNCPAEYHDLTFTSSVAGACGKDYWFHASKQNSNPPVNLQLPAQLKNMLIWAGYPENPYLAFDSVGDDVKIDPPVEGDPTAGSGSGSCEQLVQYSSGACGAVLNATNNTRTIGSCCKCGTGPNMTWQWKAGVPVGTWYHCKL
jgi:hypothetical protein